jgi:hypothetical protein
MREGGICRKTGIARLVFEFPGHRRPGFPERFPQGFTWFPLCGEELLPVCSLPLVRGPIDKAAYLVAERETSLPQTAHGKLVP